MSARQTSAASILLAALAASTVPAARAQAGPGGVDAVFLQAGRAGQAQSLTGGVAWDWAWQKPTQWGLWSGYWEAGMAAWRADRQAGEAGRAWFGRVGVTPVIRLAPQALPGLFVEGGVGINLVLPRYRTDRKVFSTRFNFGDHLAVGWRFGAGQLHELALRFEHLSNGGIRQPNPGENFVQLRYQHHF